MDNPGEINQEIKRCLICEQECSVNDKPLSTKVAKTLAENLSKFYKHDLLEENIIKFVKDGQERLESELGNGASFVHKSCRDKYNPSKLERLVNAKKRRISNEPSVNTRSSCPNTSQFKELCMYCDEPGYTDFKHPERSNPIHAAARKKNRRGYVEKFTSEMKKMALALEDSRMINILDQDVRSSELFYHGNCHASYLKRYQIHITEKNKDNCDIDKYIAISVLTDYIESKDTDIFDIHDLHKIYLNHMAERGKLVEPHITRFANLLKSSNIGVTVLQECTGGKYKVYKTKTLKTIIDDNEWLKLLEKVLYFLLNFYDLSLNTFSEFKFPCLQSFVFFLSKVQTKTFFN